MEFEQLQKVWDKQNKKMMYTIDESALGKIVYRKKSVAIKTARIIEIALIGANLLAGSAILISRYIKLNDNIYAIMMGVIMILTAFILLYYRSKRQSKKPIYETSIYGDVEHGLSEAKYTMRMSRISQYYFLMIGVLMVFVLGFENWVITLCAAGFVAFTLYASTWEHKCYVKKFNELKDLKKILTEEKES